MASHPAHPVLPQYTTLLQYYNNPPTGNIRTGDLGSSSTTPMAPSSLPNDGLPRHIIEDRQMCLAIMGNARAYFNNPTNPPGALSAVHYTTELSLNTSMGDVTRNIDVFALLSLYVRVFVQIADGLGVGDIQVGHCDQKGDVGPNRRIIRHGADKIIVEIKSQAAFDRHACGIQALACANNGDGTELNHTGYETDARSIIFKLGMHMINRNCSWGLLIGGKEFFVFYLDRCMDGNDIYHHLVLSGRHANFPRPANVNTPALMQVLIALLLGNPPIIRYSPPRASIKTRCLERKISETSPKTGVTRSRAGRRIGISGRDSGHHEKRTGLEARLETLLDGIQHCTLAYPNSGMPERELALARVDFQKAREALSDSAKDLPETDPYSRGPHPISLGNERSGQLLAFQQLGSGVCGEVYDSHLIVNGHNAPCAAKVVQYEFGAFCMEVSAYEQLQGRQFVPKFYGALAGMWATGPLGVILMERLNATFNSYDEMTIEEKYGALKCLEQLHLLGLEHGDVSPRNFGKRDGEIIIMDFSHTGPCGACDGSGTYRACSEMLYLRKTLFGNGEA